MDENPIRTARRLTRREQQSLCLQCGRQIEVENHHVAGERHDRELTAPLCQACHAQVTENLRRAGVDMRRAPNNNERVRRALKATAVFLWMLADALWRWAESLVTSTETEGESSSVEKSFGDSPRKEGTTP